MSKLVESRDLRIKTKEKKDLKLGLETREMHFNLERKTDIGLERKKRGKKYRTLLKISKVFPTTLFF